MRRSLRRPAIVFACTVALGLLAAESAHATPPSICPREPTLLVDTDAHRLLLCESGKTTATFSVRIGKNGVGKSKEGDGKTPLGRYGIAGARASAQYGKFIPIGYPTEAQRRVGLTGGAVGVHGPDRRLTWAGRFVNAFDTTDGCVGLATDDEMNRVAAWVDKTHAGAIVIR